eukprot:CAMPEP_0119017338 /NCGR_PEP_ID=MMETSP1176-20130426/16255_1 /TAXON_ID=265551 /ORGANISM="Synedropsis recta cf, Strain CCMP1620" /LENGTH=356 /DNA_ID=CAMNT_0006971035 /DNA_START=29 /DNA_END=1095 /DNA_ORIENTATION=+
MAPKTITVLVDATGSGAESKEMLSNEEGYKNLVSDYSVASLKDNSGAKIRDFESLKDGGRYTLGDINTSIPQRQRLAPSTSTRTIKLKYNKSMNNWTTDATEGKITLEALTEFARNSFGKIEVAKLEFRHNCGVIKNDVDVVRLKDGSVVEVLNKQVAFSSVKSIKQAFNLVSRESQKLEEDDSVFPEEVELGDSNVNLVHALSSITRLKTLVPIVQGCEATRRLYIDPILCAAGLDVGGITMKVEESIEDAQFNGDVDYLFSFNDTVICVTEGKKDQLEHGIAQNIAQLSTVRANRKRTHAEISAPPTFGIATTFIEWVFIKYEDERVVQSKLVVVNPDKAEDITSILGRCIGLL